MSNCFINKAYRNNKNNKKKERKNSALFGLMIFFWTWTWTYCYFCSIANGLFTKKTIAKRA